MNGSSSELIKDHYRRIASEHGDSPSSTLIDEVSREKESAIVLSFLEKVVSSFPAAELRILDLGCGNGYSLSLAAKHIPQAALWGVDYSAELLQIARDRKLASCTLAEGDARSLDFEDAFFDAVYTQRCLINLLDPNEQQQAFGEVARVLKPGGLCLLIECFTDGFDKLNQARGEFDLPPLKTPYHNRYFDKSVFCETVAADFDILNADGGFPAIPMNFLSSHYFMARAIHPLLCKGNDVRNSEFVKFFSHLPPMGNYAAIQAFLLRKKE